MESISFRPNAASFARAVPQTFGFTGQFQLTSENGNELTMPFVVRDGELRVVGFSVQLSLYETSISHELFARDLRLIEYVNLPFSYRVRSRTRIARHDDWITAPFASFKQATLSNWTGNPALTERAQRLLRWDDAATDV